MVTFEDATKDSPYPTLRDVQKDGIKATIEAIDDDGFLVAEGPCGTGKTLLSLLPISAYIKDNSTKYNQALVVTSVKQQQEIFEEELRRINSVREDNDKDPLSTVTLVGKKDVCPYVKHDTISEDEIQSTCESLREGTRDQLRDADDEEVIAKRMQVAAQPPDGKMVQRFDTDGTYEYPFDVDELPEGSCPFYAGYQESKYNAKDSDGEYDPEDVLPFDPTSYGVMDASDIVHESGKAGMCPHSALGEAIECTDIVIGNYMHIFDEKTRNFTESLIRDDTLIIVDEAHNLVPKVRGILSENTTLNSVRKGLQELRELYSLVTDSFGDDAYWDTHEDLARESMFLSSPADVKQSVELLEGLREESFSNVTTANGHEQVSKAATGDKSAELGEVVTTYESFYTDLYNKFLDLTENELGSNKAPFETELRDPDELKPDKISQWLGFKGEKQLLDNTEAFGKAMTALKSFLTSELYEDPTVETDIQATSEFFQEWADTEYDRYFQSFTVSERYYQPNQKYIDREWQNDYKVTLDIQNCLPRTEIKDVLDSFGGGILMSATLEPLDMYIEETGLSLFEDRPIVQRSYNLRYPKENRETIISPTTKFKYTQRGSHRSQNPQSNVEHNVDNPVRQEYKEIIESVVETTPGNVLIIMPSYSEAWWAGEVISAMNELPENNILVDEKSNLQETTDLKQEFFEGGKKVLVTGARGTLTEGVDYTGERLKAALVCGVPIANTNNLFNTAVETTYDKYFENGFEYAFTLPAVRKARQAIGRVIRGADERGVRLFADERYSETQQNWDSVHEYLPEYLKDESQELAPSLVRDELESFWDSNDN